MSYKDGGWKNKYFIAKREPSGVCQGCQMESIDPFCPMYMDSAIKSPCPVREIVPVDPEAQYFVLRFDTDPHAREAMLAYANSVEAENPLFAREIREHVRPYLK